MGIAVQRRRDGPFHLHHPVMWFILFLIAIWILLGKEVGAGTPGRPQNQWVIAYSSTLMPMA